jgi:hypothetical protein
MIHIVSDTREVAKGLRCGAVAAGRQIGVTQELSVRPDVQNLETRVDVSRAIPIFVVHAPSS